MAKKIKTVLKLNLMAGKANPAPPVGPALGQHGINIMDFCNQYNEATKDRLGQVLPAQVTIYEDRSFDFVIKLPPVSDLIKQTLKLEKGSGTAGKDVVGTLSQAQVEAIAKTKLPDLNTQDLNAAIRTVSGTARSLGIKVE
ncbi:50S ribosomal protein L11 [Microgenomates group bacterium RBG_16_45_19]|nr:MAG: 50S ribosomal protein L11 [Microgenomates group bacterium RBG_16_45_19]